MEGLTDFRDRTVEGNTTTGYEAHQIVTRESTRGSIEVCVVPDQDTEQSSTSSSTTSECRSKPYGVPEMYITTRSDSTSRTRNP